MPYNFTVPDDPNNPYPGVNPIPQPGAFADFIMGQQGGNPSNQGAGDVSLPPVQSAPDQTQAPSTAPPPPGGAPDPTQTQAVTATPQGPLPPQMSASSSMGQQAVASGGQKASGSPSAMFTDPTALLAIAATLGQSPNFGESGIGQVARALQAGNQVIMAKNYQAQQETRQAALDAQEAQKNQADTDFRIAQTAQTAQQTAEAQDVQSTKKEAMRAEIDVAKQRIASAKTADARQQAETAYQNLTNTFYKKYGERIEAAKADQGEATVAGTRATTAGRESETGLNVVRATEINANTARLKAEADKWQMQMDAMKTMTPEDKERVLFGGKVHMTDADKLQSFIEKNEKAYTTADRAGNPTGMNWAAAKRDFASLFPDSSYGKQFAGQPSVAEAHNELRARVAAKKITPEQANAWLQKKQYPQIQFDNY